MNNGQLLVAATQIFPIGDFAEEDIGQLLLIEFQITAWLVVSHGNGASCHGQLHHAPLHLRNLFGLHRHVTGTEVHRFANELTHSGA